MTDSAVLCDPYLRGYPIDGVAISTLGRTFGGETIAASDPTAARLDEIQLDLGQGPCWDAIAAGAPVSLLDTGTDVRWPLFAEAVDALDVRSVFAFPLTFAGLSIGAVDLYTRTPITLDDAALTEISAQSPATSLRVLAAVLHDDADEVSSNPGSRRVVHQATGMIIARYRLDSDDALVLLRAHAFAQHRPLVDVAQDIVARQDGFPDRPLTVQDDSW
ncbi:ANTAR domain-containing protein [Rathayibacter sp. PhB152]|uniref:GAF and ANTAR domain-containing protein n=1 Tax=unclassified Rathayibacter TaxID=2609250 RepID=UPI000F4B6109|nr:MULTISPECIES: GAF and ANTAR domain-containing protein [unclassified Rathayibacter]ROQ60273.1 ANTAR domain-containing protein [Rathayibacter sp. PhB152]ROS21446.1 ANTAR domain-containing protein [Rathayibacter sp. PhB127]TDX82037.1 ANTAR domain-containing protein [Rathayibacter sp. PhB151]